MKRTNFHLRTDDAGRPSYFPWGVGRGFILPNEKTAKRVRWYTWSRNACELIAIVLCVRHGISLLHTLATTLGFFNLLMPYCESLFFRRYPPAAAAAVSITEDQSERRRNLPAQCTWLAIAALFVFLGVYACNEGEIAFGVGAIMLFGLGATILACEIVSELFRRLVRRTSP